MCVCSQRFDLLRDIQCGSWSDMKRNYIKNYNTHTFIKYKLHISGRAQSRERTVLKLTRTLSVLFT